MRKKKMVKLIIEAIQLPGEEYTDGECMDEVIQIIERAGYDFKWEEYWEKLDKSMEHRLLPMSDERRKQWDETGN
jgi:hypothetical protein